MIKIVRKLNSSILIPYENQWVALSNDMKKVIAADENFKKLSKKLDNMGIGKDSATLHYVPRLDGYHSY